MHVLRGERAVGRQSNVDVLLEGGDAVEAVVVLVPIRHGLLCVQHFDLSQSEVNGKDALRTAIYFSGIVITRVSHAGSKVWFQLQREWAVVNEINCSAGAILASSKVDKVQ